MRLRLFAISALCWALFSGALSAAQDMFQGRGFEARVISSPGRQFREFSRDGQALLKVRPNEEYSIVVFNPLPVRAAVAVTVDGLNSIDGKRTSPREAQKWMIAPHSSLTITGWQTDKHTARKFVFTDSTETYAKWRQEREGKAYTRNLGVIGVAWFWNSQELEAALHPPEPFASSRSEESVEAGNSADSMRENRAAPAAAKAERQAGTGMGRPQSNPVTEVEFDANAGMFSVRDVLKIFYEFAQEPPQPQPFVSEEDESGRFAPDMYK